jgi:hypothetical protein
MTPVVSKGARTVPKVRSAASAVAKRGQTVNLKENSKEESSVGRGLHSEGDPGTSGNQMNMSSCLRFEHATHLSLSA